MSLFFITSTINFWIFFHVPPTFILATSGRLDYTCTIFCLDIGGTDVTKNSRLFAVNSTTSFTLLLAACVYRLPAHPVSVPIRYPSDKISAVVSFETGIKINRKYNKIPLKYEHTVHSSVWCPGCFPGTWRRDSWHFEVANLHLQLIMDLCPLHVLIIFPFFLPGASKRSGWRMPPAKRSAMGYHTA